MKRMNPRSVRWMAALTGICAAMTMAVSSASAAPIAGHSTGTLPDGATWIADVPAHWNGTLLLYSHGYGPPVAQDMSDPTTRGALLSMGYAMARSSYDPNGPWWALGSALRDQFRTEAIVRSASTSPGCCGGPPTTPRSRRCTTRPGSVLTTICDRSRATRP